MKDHIDDILTEYDSRRSVHERLCGKLEVLMQELIVSKNLSFHSIATRVKSRPSLMGKIVGDESKYNCLNDITDISGARVITYFQNDVDLVADIIESEFDIDNDNSIDKRKAAEHDRFGYASLHYVVKLNSERLQLTEYSSFSDYTAEIQVRSILQHAWAEIEHDLGYKSQMEIPFEVRRRFSRLAGVLELVDDEFELIKESIDRYSIEVSKDLDEKKSSLLIDKISLHAFISSSTLVRAADEAIANANGRSVGKMVDLTDHIPIVDMLNSLGIISISQLEDILANDLDDIVALSRLRLNSTSHMMLSRGASIIYVCYLYAYKTLNKKEIIEYVNSIPTYGYKHFSLNPNAADVIWNDGKAAGIKKSN